MLKRHINRKKKIVVKDHLHKKRKTVFVVNYISIYFYNYILTTVYSTYCLHMMVVFLINNFIKLHRNK